MIQGRRAVGIPLVVVLALLAAVLLAPSGSTHALWTDSEPLSPGGVASDGISLSASVQQEGTQLPGTSTVTVENTSARLAGLLSVSPSVAPVGWDGGLSDQLDISYAECATGVQVGTSRLGAGERQDVCVTTTPPVSGADLLRNYAGATVEVTSNVTQQAADAPSWTSSAAVTTRHHIDFPRPTHPGERLTRHSVCEGAVFGSATLKWAWPDTDGRQSTGTPAVEHWAIQEETSPGVWREVVGNIPADARSASVTGQRLWGVNSHWLRVVGYSAADPATPVGGTFKVNVTSVGSSLFLRCNWAEGI